MIKNQIIRGCACLVLAFAVVHAEDTPAQQAEKVRQQAMAKALADKAKNDAIVAQQRAAEAAAKNKTQKEKSAPKPAPPVSPK